MNESYVLAELQKEDERLGDRAKIDRLNELLVREYMDGGCEASQAPRVWPMRKDIDTQMRFVLTYAGGGYRYAYTLQEIVAMVWGEAVKS